MINIVKKSLVHILMLVILTSMFCIAIFGNWNQYNIHNTVGVVQSDVLLSQSQSNLDSVRYKHAKDSEGQKFVLTLDPNGGNAPIQTLGVEYGESMPTPTGEGLEIIRPTRLNHVFLGFWDEPEDGGKQYYGILLQSINDWDKPNDSILYARWRSRHIVSFDQMGGVRGTRQITVLFNQGMESGINPPIRTMYRFLGYWSQPEYGGTQYYDADMNNIHIWDIKGDGVLYARWVSATAGEGFGLLDYNDYSGQILFYIGMGSALGIVLCLILLRKFNKTKKKCWRFVEEDNVWIEV
ncbi:MAG: InlB B-repeat-containing protein [Clostridiales bacterium]|jgi:hypothetical protein|nr:InlB B-repeat-containing protein [Clostridiales bacterium]